jgi:hypothetical protein
MLVPPPSPSPYRTLGVVEASRPAKRIEPIERTARAAAPADEPEPIGDHAGEHLYMTRGRYSAWPYVVVAFLLESAILGAIPIFILQFALHPFTSDPELGAALGLLVGTVLAYLVFRDRWRCIEATASRFCSGLMNLSILYVPFVALIYANARGLAKLR